LTSYAGRTSFSLPSPRVSSASGPPTRRPSESISAARVGPLLSLLIGIGVNPLFRVWGLGRIDHGDELPPCCGASMKVKKSRSGLLRARRNRILHVKTAQTTITAAAANIHSKIFLIVIRPSSGESMPVPLGPIACGIGDALLSATINIERTSNLKEATGSD